MTASSAVEALLTRDDSRLALSGSRCRGCGELYFPAAQGCTRCGSDQLDVHDLGGTGRLWSWTIQDFCPKTPYNGAAGDQFVPYGVGYVELDSGLKVESRLTVADPARLHIGMAMSLVRQVYGQTPQGEPLTALAFEPRT